MIEVENAVLKDGKEFSITYIYSTGKSFTIFGNLESKTQSVIAQA